MKKIFIFLTIIIFTSECYSQFVYKLKADSVKVTNDSCSSELIIENSSKNVCGFLFNNGNGRTTFKRGLTPISNKKYVIGCDTLDLSGSSAAGLDGHIQFNNNGFFGASSNLSWNNVTGSLNIGEATTSSAKLTVKGAGSGANEPKTIFAESAGSENTSAIYGLATGGSINIAVSGYSTGGSNYNLGVDARALNAGITGVGAQAISYNAVSSNYGVYARAFGGGDMNYSIYAGAPIVDTPGVEPIKGKSNYAGYFNGDIFTTGSYLPSDEKLKNKIKTEDPSLEKIKKLNPVSYSYVDNTKYIALPKGLQHGFIAQELQKVFPEMVNVIKAPIFEKDILVGQEDILAINYPMLISILTNAVKEQQSQIEIVKVKTDKISKSGVTPEFENNDTAIKGGLSVGDFYRTGDILKVVH